MCTPLDGPVCSALRTHGSDSAPIGGEPTCAVTSPFGPSMLPSGRVCSLTNSTGDGSALLRWYSGGPLTVRRGGGGTAMNKLRIVILGFGTARQKLVLE
jgi:hypothetical protein